MLKKRPGGLLQLKKKTGVNKKDRYNCESGIEIKSRVLSEPPSVIERSRSMENNSLSMNRDNSGFARVVNALDLDERYQIQLQLQALYARLDVLARRADNPSYASQAWSDDEEENDDVESYVRRDSEQSGGQASMRHPVSKQITMGGRGGKMASVVEEDIFEDASSGGSELENHRNHRYFTRKHSY